MKTKTYGDTMFFTTPVNINGEIKEIIPAFVEYAKMNAPNPYHGEASVNIQQDYLLDCIFNFAKPEQFWKENIELKDFDGTPIPDKTPDVLVYLADGVSFWQFPFRSEPLKANVINFPNYKDYFIAMGTTNYGTRAMNNVELAGLAYMITQKDAYKNVHYLANKYKMQFNTASKFLGVELKQRVTKAITMGVDNDVPVSCRKLEEAEALYKAVYRIFGERIAKARYAANAINLLLKKYDFETVLKAIELIEFETAEYIRIVGCGDKESCIMGSLVEVMANNNLIKAA